MYIYIFVADVDIHLIVVLLFMSVTVIMVTGDCVKSPACSSLVCRALRAQFSRASRTAHLNRD
jgi:hypothetical protein